MPPKQDLRGGKASADSFAISSTVFVASMKRCLFAAESYELAHAITYSISYMNLARPLLRSSFGVVFSEIWTYSVESRQRDVGIRFVVVRKVEAPTP
jgi:hypothetical protein